jgi:hypothetical protein
MSKNHLIEGRQSLTVIGYDTTTVSSSRESSLSQELVQRPILQMFIDMELVEATIIIFQQQSEQQQRRTEQRWQPSSIDPTVYSLTMLRPALVNYAAQLYAPWSVNEGL